MGIRNVASCRELKERLLRHNSTTKIDIMELDLSSEELMRKLPSEFNSCSFHILKGLMRKLASNQEVLKYHILKGLRLLCYHILKGNSLLICFRMH